MKWRYWIERPPASFDIRDEIILENLTFEPTDRVLEVGIGFAGTTYRLASQVASVTAIDISEDLVQYLSDRKRVPNIDFRKADATDPRTVEMIPGPFDRVISGDTLEHVENPVGFFRTVAAALKPGGTFLCTFPNERPPSHGITRFQTRSELVELLHHAGFSAARFYHVELRSHARLVQIVFADTLIRLVRLARRNASKHPQVFHETWTFQARLKLEPFRVLIHAYWGFLSSLMKLSRPIYRILPAGEEILDRRLLIIARK